MNEIYLYVVYDGVDGGLDYFKTEEEAKVRLNSLIANSKEEWEWMEDIEMSFIAKIITLVEAKEVEAPEDYRLDSGISKWFDMQTKDI